MKILIEKIKNKFKKNDLIKKLAHGGIWLSFGSSIEQILRLIRNMILARILAPEAFGILALLLSINQFFESFTNIGTKESIIQDEDGYEDAYLNGAWWFSFLRGILLYILLFAFAPLLAKFFKNDDFTLYLRLISLSLIFRSAISIKAYVELKKISFKKWTLIEQTAGVIGVLTAITLSIILVNVWALIIGFLVESFCRFLISYILCPYFPGLKFDKHYLRKFLKFARGIFGISIFTFIYLRADIFFISKLCSATILGLYSLAVSLAYVPSLFLEKFVGPLFLPAFSEIKSDKQKVNKALIKITQIFSIIGIPLIFFSVLYGREILTILYSHKYSEVAIPFAILFSTNILRTLITPFAAIYLSFGMPNYLRNFNIIRAVIIILLLYPLTKYFGVIGASLSVLIAMIISSFLQIRVLKKIINLNSKKYWFSIFKPLLLFIPTLVIWLVPNYWQMRLMIQIIFICIGFLTFLFMLIFYNRKYFFQT